MTDTDDDARVQWSRDRTRMARERTFASWMRTAVTALAAGLVFTRLIGDVEPRWAAIAIGVALVLAGAAAQAIGFWRYRGSFAAVGDARGGSASMWALGALSLVVVVCAVGAAVLLLRSDPGQTAYTNTKSRGGTNR